MIESEDLKNLEKDQDKTDVESTNESVYRIGDKSNTVLEEIDISSAKEEPIYLGPGTYRIRLERQQVYKEEIELVFSNIRRIRLETVVSVLKKRIEKLDQDSIEMIVKKREPLVKAPFVKCISLAKEVLKELKE